MRQSRFTETQIVAMNRPEFCRHLRALQCNCSGGGHEWEAVLGGIQG